MVEQLIHEDIDRAGTPPVEPAIDRAIDPAMAPFAAAMLAPDVLAGGLDITAVTVAPGRVVCRLTVSRKHVNQAGFTHGGTLFTLADTAVGIASSRPGGAIPLGTFFGLQILRSSSIGDTLEAEAVEVRRGRTLIAQQITIKRVADDALVAIMTAQLLLTERRDGADG
jgi:acyl-CoA thioesterase